MNIIQRALPIGLVCGDCDNWLLDMTKPCTICGWIATSTDQITSRRLTREEAQERRTWIVRFKDLNSAGTESIVKFVTPADKNTERDVKDWFETRSCSAISVRRMPPQGRANLFIFTHY